ncbi:hypothetical protein Acr_16g0010500 [Actinidia rufa]|uniref:CCHC-type domain-containing protein n=1 Tax=Actinidia rufa TaxID=165716 RepID=A0A7J0G0G5_9ERIC|nr:hypothetical protein Acr_16g0010500 [Actinidia rufa]
MVFGKICSKLGKPIHMDMLTTRKERITYARCLVEVDMSEERVHSVILNLAEGGEHQQMIYYENLPKYCSHCKKVGHIKENCKVKQAVRMEVGGKYAGPDMGNQPTGADAGKGQGSQKEWVLKTNVSTKGNTAANEPEGCSSAEETAAAVQEVALNLRSNTDANEPEGCPPDGETAPQEAALNLESIPSHPSLGQPQPESNLETDNQITEHKPPPLVEPNSEIPPPDQIGKEIYIEQANQIASMELRSKL